MKLEYILNRVSLYYNVSPSAIKGESRKYEIAEVRQVYCYLARKYTRESLVQIGLSINKDHSTVFHSVKKIEGLMNIYPKFKNTILELVDLITINTPIKSIIVQDIDLLSISKAYSRTVLN